MQRNLLYLRNKVYPKSPQSYEEVVAAFNREEVMKSFGLTKHVEKSNFFKTVQKSSHDVYCLFASDIVINNIKKEIPVDRRHILMDATFKVCPKGIFKQLLIIYISYMGQVFHYLMMFDF